ncbi:MAG: transglutaminase family protein [bacterium JZ-2024 1]
MPEPRLSIHLYIFLYFIGVLGLAGLFWTESIGDVEMLVGLLALHLGILVSMSVSPAYYRLFRVGCEVVAYEVVLLFLYFSITGKGSFPLYIGKIILYLLICYIFRIFQGSDLLMFLSWPLATSIYLASISTFPRIGPLVVAVAILLIFLTVGGEFSRFSPSGGSIRGFELRVGWNYALWGILFSLLGFLMVQYITLPQLRVGPWGAKPGKIKRLVPLEFSDDLSPVEVRYSGFSPYLQLARGERIHESEDLALRVRAGSPGYFRGVVFSEYIGKGWRIPGGFPLKMVDAREFNILQVNDRYTTAETPNPVRKTEISQVYTVVKPHPNFLLHLWKPVQIRFSLPAFSFSAYVMQDDTLSLRTSFLLEPDFRYRIVSEVIGESMEEVLRWEEELPEKWDARWSVYLSLPPLPERVKVLARRVAGSGSVSQKMTRLMDFLLREYTYTLDVPKIPQGQDAVDFFLFESRRGYCEYFASALAVLARSVGIPARVVGGYRGGTYDALSGDFLIYEKDAHTWVEYYLPGVGWAIADATPEAGFPLDSENVPGTISPPASQLFFPGSSPFNRFLHLWSVLQARASEWLYPWTLLSRENKLLFRLLIFSLALVFLIRVVYRDWWKFWEERKKMFRTARGRMFLLLRRLERQSRLMRPAWFTLREYERWMKEKQPEYAGFSSEFLPVLEQMIYNEREVTLDEVHQFELKLSWMRKKGFRGEKK